MNCPACSEEVEQERVDRCECGYTQVTPLNSEQTLVCKCDRASVGYMANLEGLWCTGCHLKVTSIYPYDKHTEEQRFLEWVADRLVFVYKESENVDFVQKLRKISRRKW